MWICVRSPSYLYSHVKVAARRETVEHLQEALGRLGEHRLDRDAGRQPRVRVQLGEAVLEQRRDDHVEVGQLAEALLDRRLGRGEPLLQRLALGQLALRCRREAHASK